MRGEIRTLLSSSFFSSFYFFAHLLLFPTEQNGISVNSFHRFLYIIRKMNPLFEKDVFIHWHHYSFPIYINSINQKNPYIPLILFFFRKKFSLTLFMYGDIVDKYSFKEWNGNKDFWNHWKYLTFISRIPGKNWTLWLFNMMQPRGRDMKWS